MTTQIKTLRENIIKAISGIKDDNVSIAGVAINRKTLLDALKLQTSDTVTIQYGKMAWIDGSFGEYPSTKNQWHDMSLQPETALQITCDHTVMRFLNRPKEARRGETKTSPLAFIDHKTESIKPVTGIPLDTRELLEALTYVLPCVAVEESRFVLRCVCFDVKNEVLTLATADGYRMAIAKLPIKTPDMRVIVRIEDIIRMVAFLKSIKPEGRGKSKTYPQVYFSANDKEISLAITGKQVDAPTQVGTFPAYETLIPSGGTQVEFIASDMLEAVNALAPYSKDGSGIIRLQMYNQFPNGIIRISARSEELGESSSEVDSNVQADCRIAADYRYLTALLKLCGDNKVTLRVLTPSSPMVFETAVNRLTVVMPMFVEWGQADTKPEPVNIDNSESELVEARES